MCYKKWQSFRSSIFKAILHERKAIFPTKQTYITKQMQWYFYILRKKRKCYFKTKSGMIFILLSILEKYWSYIKINSKRINGGGGTTTKFSIKLRMKIRKNLHSYHRMPPICCFLGLIYPECIKKSKYN